MDCKSARIALDRIDAEDLFYRITTPQDKPPLEASIRRLGLISPLVVKAARENGPMAIVSGFRRLSICRRLGWAQVPCRVLPNDASPASCADIAVTANLTQRTLNLVEQARCLALLNRTATNASAADSIAESLGLSRNRALATKLKTVAAASECIQEALVMGTIGLPTALALAEMTEQTAERIVTLFRRLPMGLNKQREILLWLTEIAAREETAIAHLLDEGDLKGILDGDHLDGNQKTHRLRSYLRQRRYPRLVSVEKAFEGCVRELPLGPSLQITPPPGFEGRTCRLTLRFSGPQDIKWAERRLSRIADHPALTKLFETL